MRMAIYIRRKILILVGIFTFLGQIAGLTTPWWVVIKSLDNRMVHGLWYSLQCDVSSGISFCESRTKVTDSIFGTTRVGYGLETLFGCVMNIMGTVFLVLYDPRENTSRAVMTGALSSALYVISGILTWVAVGSVSSEKR
ncbi:hypothetical protein FSP39_022256 [Pinctada imbricata]|uniref:Claudin n=1 Tax=Pinctada imbricata TaxID=66713 RepID=A0AA89BRU2_PINIB|nr:hypothetical protein FSP39_022256 [Pinctada imbricata]